MYPQLSRNPAVLAVVFCLYFWLGKLGLTVGGFGQTSTAVWPPSGFALAAIVILGPRIWPAIFAGAFAVYATSSGYLGTSMALAVGQTLEALFGAALVDRFASGPHVFRSPKSVFRLVAIAAVASSVSASVSLTNLDLAEHAPLTDYVSGWITMWIANFTGVLVVAPFALLWTTTPLGRIRIAEVLEAALLLLLIIVVGLIVFGGWFPSGAETYPLEFLCVPGLIWAGFRFGRREMASAIVIISGLAVWGTERGLGPFGPYNHSERLVLVQAYIAVMAIMGAALAAVVAEHKDAEAQLRELATTDSLTGLVNYRRLIEIIKAEIGRSQRTKTPFALVFIDMDGLKAINDKHGHLVGSRSLSRVADALRRSCRTVDTPARFGGDEFAIVLPESTYEGGTRVLQRVSERLSKDGSKPTLSVSGGVAVYPRDGETPTLLMRAADRALYEAKAARGAARAAAISRASST
jgi:diguanylate cyclase (GGDEF)-like protein